mgnify:CR=1 FL=1
MKFVHIADVHFDAPFSTISDRAELGQTRRLEQREAFKKVIEFIKKNNIENLFISGDLYEQLYVRKSTIIFINNLFKEIPNTKIYITPGNHDPYIKASYYNCYEWEKNVKIFTSQVEKIENEDAIIYGFGFDNYEMNKNQLNEIVIEQSNKPQILITHGTVVSGNDTKGIYNPMSAQELLKKGFDYIALGHIHKRDEVYSGSLISLGFDEPGEHGFICGEIINKKLYTKFIKIDNREFVKKEFDVSDIYSEEELIEKLNNINTENNLYEINLIGERKFEININIKLIQNTAKEAYISCLIAPFVIFKITFANKSGNIALTIASKTLTNPYPNRFHFACFIYFQVFLTFNLKLLLLSLCIFHLSFFILTLKVFEVLHLQFVLNNLIDFQELQNIKLLLLIYLIHNRYF